MSRRTENAGRSITGGKKAAMAAHTTYASAC